LVIDQKDRYYITFGVEIYFLTEDFQTKKVVSSSLDLLGLAHSLSFFLSFYIYKLYTCMYRNISRFLRLPYCRNNNTSTLYIGKKKLLLPVQELQQKIILTTKRKTIV